MSISQNMNIAYSFNQPLSSIFPSPIVSNRAPLNTDKSQIGTVWINKSANSAWILTSVVSNSATWESISGGAGAFANLTVTGNALLGTSAGSAVTVGNTSASTSINLNTPAGTPVAVANGVTLNNGNLVLSTAATYVQLPGPIKIMSGAGIPANGLATEAGDLYVRTDPASATTRLYIATAAGTWTNVTCAA